MRLLAWLFVVVLLGATAPLRAAHPTACGGSWTGQRDCVFRVGEAHLKIGGTATATGTARVRVWVAPVFVGTQELPLVQCSAEGPSRASCSAEVLIPTGLDPGGEVVLVCQVRGASSGTYSCGTGAY